MSQVIQTDLNKYLIYNEQHDQSIKNGRQKADDLSTALRQKRTDLELAIAEKKVLLYMASRHKADRVFYDQKKYNLEK